MAARVANITAEGRRRRVVLGVVMGLAGVAVTAGVLVGGASPWWVVVAWPPFWAAALGLLQARETT
jgi:hypothetical protein